MAAPTRARAAIRSIFRRGGRPIRRRRVHGVACGEDDHPLSAPWEGFLLVLYPSRLAMRDMNADEKYRAALPHRNAGVECSVLYPTTPWR